MSDPITSHPDYVALESWWQSALSQSLPILDQNGVDALWWQYGLFSDAIVQDADELNQAVQLVLNTPQGSDIHRPEFSSGIWNYIDYPIPRATPFVVRESTQALAQWEPRITLDAVSVQTYNPGIAGITVNAIWTVADSDVSGQTEVSLG